MGSKKKPRNKKYQPKHTEKIHIGKEIYDLATSYALTFELMEQVGQLEDNSADAYAQSVALLRGNIFLMHRCEILIHTLDLLQVPEEKEGAVKEALQIATQIRNSTIHISAMLVGHDPQNIHLADPNVFLEQFKQDDDETLLPIII